MAPDSALSRTSAFHTRYTLNRYPSATAPLCRATCRRSAFQPTSASHPARLNCHSLPCLLPSLWPHGRSSPARTLSAVFRRCSSRTRSHLNTRHIAFCHRDFALMLTLQSLWFVMQQQQVMLAHYPVKPFGVHRWLSLCATLLAQDAPHASITITRHIADDVEDSRQYFSVCFVITPVTAPILPVGRTVNPQ